MLQIVVHHFEISLRGAKARAVGRKVVVQGFFQPDSDARIGGLYRQRQLFSALSKKMSGSYTLPKRIAPIDKGVEEHGGKESATRQSDPGRIPKLRSFKLLNGAREKVNLVE